MDLQEKMDLFINEANKIPDAIKAWVADYIYARHQGNTKLAKEMKKSIDKEIKSLGLNKKDVYNYFGDPDDPKEKDKVIKKVKEYQGYN